MDKTTSENHALTKSQSQPPSALTYDFAMLFWRVITQIFFREVRPRGAFNIPKADEGPVIFVGAPHNNQFLDLNLGVEVYKETGRRVRFLVAAASMRRRIIGDFARMFECIPVERAADKAVKGIGLITLSPTDPTLIIGKNTQFTKQVTPRMQILLSKAVSSLSAEVLSVISDTELRLKKEFGGGEKGTAKVKEKCADAQAGGLDFKVLPVVDQGEMYKHVYQCLQDGGSIGIFPEGGSHDRTDLLPLKAGVAIMALGAMANNPSCKVKIVPVGLSYFHAHRFRSRAVVEFGRAFDVPQELVDKFKEGGPQKREAVAKFLDIVYDSLKTVTVRAPDYDTLMLVQAARRLYKTPGQHLTLGQVVELNRRLVEGYIHFKDEPRIMKLSEDVRKYNRRLRDLGLRDHQVPRAMKSPWKIFGLLSYRLALLTVWTVFALPGTVLNGPIFIIASIISRKKAKEALANSTVKIAGKDVLATWKILIALVITPILYALYACIALYIAVKAKAPLKWKIATPFLVGMVLPVMNYAALKFGEAGMDVLKSMRPLVISLFPGQQKQFDHLRQLRERLSNEVVDVINEFGPKLYDNFDQHRILVPSASAPPSTGGAPSVWRRNHSSVGNVDAQGLGLVHPMTWIDERLFGWSRSSKSHSGDSSGTVTPTFHDEVEDHDDGDYEGVLRVIDDHHLQFGGGLSASRIDTAGKPKSRQGSYADLQRLKMTQSNSSANAPVTFPPAQGSRSASISPSRGGMRRRRESLSDLIKVGDIAHVEKTEEFQEATRELNAGAAAQKDKSL